MKNLKVEITEMFVAKADKDRVYFGCIKRSRNEKDEMNLFSRIAMPDGGVLCANETDQKVLAKNLNSMAVMILDKNLHDDEGEYFYLCSPTDKLVVPITDTAVRKCFLN
jgi:hypothetical protein